MRRVVATGILLAVVGLAPAALAQGREPAGTSGFVRLAPQEAVRAEAPPQRDPVGGFQFGVLAGVQLRGSASGQFGVTLGYFKPSTSNVGLELEAALTRGPDGNLYHGILSVILQSGSRSTRMVPYLAFGGGVYRAEVKLRDSLAETLPEFGITPDQGTETGGLLAFGVGIRYYMSEGLSFRADFREFKALTTTGGGFFDRLFSMRRIAGFMLFKF